MLHLEPEVHVEQEVGFVVGGVIGLVLIAIVGLIIGAVARLLMPGPDPGGWFVTILLGIAGSWIGSAILGMVGLRGTVMSLIGAVAGAMLLLFVYRLFKRSSASARV
jgi:uncharacterized membrane protein YeaQ/YmgE (transglycosylase-associated protein family)